LTTGADRLDLPKVRSFLDAKNPSQREASRGVVGFCWWGRTLFQPINATAQEDDSDKNEPGAVLDGAINLMHDAFGLTEEPVGEQDQRDERQDHLKGNPGVE